MDEPAAERTRRDASIIFYFHFCLHSFLNETATMTTLSIEIIELFVSACLINLTMVVEFSFSSPPSSNLLNSSKTPRGSLTQTNENSSRCLFLQKKRLVKRFKKFLLDSDFS